MKNLTRLVIFVLIISNCISVHASLVFGGTTSDRANCGSNAVLDDLNTWTTIAWIFPTTFTSLRIIASKGDLNSPFGARDIRLNGTGGNLQARIERVTTRTDYITNDTPLSPTNQWYFVAVTYDINASAGELINIYVGTLTTIAAERTYGTAQDGAGALLADAGGSFFWGNNGLTASAFRGRIGIGGTWNRVLTLEEIRQQQFRTHITANNVLLTMLGLNGTGTQPDLSGNGNNCIVTSATVGDHIPLGSLYANSFHIPNSKEFIDFALQ